MNIQISQQKIEYISLLKDTFVTADAEGNETPFFSMKFLIKEFLGFTDAMLELNEEEGDPSSEFEKALTEKRNADWLTQLPLLMNDNPSFIAVGALHLAGPKGVIEGLRNHGFTVEPVIVDVTVEN